MRYSIGIDIGGTKIDGILANEKGKILKRYRIKTQANKSKKEIINNIIKVIKKLKTRKIEGIGIGIAGVIDKRGKILFDPNIKNLEGINIIKELKKKLNHKFYITNDANCFALAESKFGAGKKAKNIVGVTFGTGIGNGIIINKKLYVGTHGGAGEFGHSIINPKGLRCKCGLRGDFESFCSGPAIVKRYYKAGGKIKNADPKNIFNSNDKIAKKVMKETYEYLGMGLANIVNALDPDLIVLGGSVSNLNFYKEVNKAVRKYANKGVAKKVKIVKHKLMDSGALGAAAFVFQ